jgi:phosphate transport system substrate-binding protein
MPDHTHLGIPPRHPRRPAVWAAAAFAVLAVSACSSSTSSAVPASAVSTKPVLTGSGSTFDAPFFSAAFPRYQQQHPGVTIDYSAVGSSAGIAAFSAGQVSFGASDVPMTANEQAAAKDGPVTQVPVDLGGEGIVYNLPLPAATRLHLSGLVLAAIFLGQITHWNDPAIAALGRYLGGRVGIASTWPLCG